MYIQLNSPPHYFHFELERVKLFVLFKHKLSDPEWIRTSHHDTNYWAWFRPPTPMPIVPRVSYDSGFTCTAFPGRYSHCGTSNSPMSHQQHLRNHSSSIRAEAMRAQPLTELRRPRAEHTHPSRNRNTTHCTVPTLPRSCSRQLEIRERVEKNDAQPNPCMNIVSSYNTATQITAVHALARHSTVLLPRNKKNKIIWAIKTHHTCLGALSTIYDFKGRSCYQPLMRRNNKTPTHSTKQWRVTT